MKKALALMLCGAMVFSLAACGDSAQSPDAPAPAPAPEPEPTKEELLLAEIRDLLKNK